MSSFKPMLAPQDDPLKRKTYFKDLKFPLLCSFKYDGIRGVPRKGTVLSRTCKALPSYQVQSEFSMLENMDGEFIEGDPCTLDCYNRTQSHVMSVNKPGDIRFFVFDCANDDWKFVPFYERLDAIKEEVIALKRDDVVFVEHKNCDDLDELLAFEEYALELEYEGIMMRNPVGHYKWNRATWNDNLIYKLKRFVDEECIIIGIYEAMTNNNPMIRDERGYAKRSTNKANMVPAGTLGGFIVDYFGVQIDVAPGAFSHKQRKAIFDNPEIAIGKFLKFRHFPKGQKDLPRFPRAIGFRDRIDMV